MQLLQSQAQVRGTPGRMLLMEQQGLLESNTSGGGRVRAIPEGQGVLTEPAKALAQLPNRSWAEAQLIGDGGKTR